MAGGTIFQLATEPIDYYIDADYIDTENLSYVDYVFDVDDEEKETKADEFVRVLPKGMFEKKDNESVIYKGGSKDEARKWVEEIHKKASEVSADNIFTTLSRYSLKEVINNPLDTSALFYVEEYSGAYPARSSSFLEWLNTLDPGTTIHIGGIVGYKF